MSRGFLLVSPRWGLLCLFVRVELLFLLLGVYYSYLFLGNYINHQKDNVSYVPLDPVDDYVYILDLNTRLRVG